MKEKILEVLRAKFAGTPNILLDRVANHLSETVTDESQIETAVDGVEKLVKSFSDILQSETDRRVTDAQKKFREKYGIDENGKPVKNPNSDKDTKEGGPDAYKKELDEMKKRLEAFEKKEKQTELFNALKNKLREKKIPESFIKGRTVESEDQIESVLAEIENDYKEVKQHLINQGVLTEKPAEPLENIDKADEAIEKWAKK